MGFGNLGVKEAVKQAATIKKKARKKPQTRAEKLKAKRAEMKAHFEKTKKAQKAKGQGKMTLKERQADDWKRAQAAAKKKHEEFKKRRKSGASATSKGNSTTITTKGGKTLKIPNLSNIK